MNNKLTDSKQTSIIAVSLAIVAMGIAAWFMGYTGRESAQVTAAGTTSQEPAATQY